MLCTQHVLFLPARKHDCIKKNIATFQINAYLDHRPPFEFFLKHISAVEYEFRISDDIDVLNTNFSAASILDLDHFNVTPALSGEREAITLVIDGEKSFTATTFLGIRAIDESGNFGEVSNIVSIVVAIGYKAEAQKYVPTSSTEAPTTTTTERHTTEKQDVTVSSETQSSVLVPVLIVLGVVVVVAIAALGVAYYLIQKKKLVNLGRLLLSSL